ncbi:MAG: N-acetyltransferase [Rhodobacteraceae bacterium]|jgi:ribosomal protein S18 acetylase RimI-like enzyme|uniref:Acetyltransferase n=1 Tax=Salipiger profundus TaxID=1229727 RepID=A0A1U7CZR5_9RHOB|nr:MULTISPECIES: GNAT family N-acetyltransferase [Salipiger]APX21399.1 acetyltransferase [Salipiger profundus]MAB08809.1 N-acetyltransferase [Paracoccaceae bacterium]GGA02647.1 GNAT family N-acetyltransferase [Salipiger profundus]
MIRALTAAEAERHAPALGALLRACVEDGASFGFVMPFAQAEAEAFWTQSVLPALGRDDRVLWAAFEDDALVGTVQLVLGMMPNQSHRAEVSKMLVHPRARRQGLGRALMATLLDRAASEGRQLVTLDTRSGDAAQALYAACGFEMAGEIPGFALAPEGTDRRDPTTYMYRRL